MKTTTLPRVRIESEPGINWVHYRAKVGKLVATFRLHQWEDQIEALHKLFPKMRHGNAIKVPDWRKHKDEVASYWGPNAGGYDNPEVIRAFSWLNDLLKSTANSSEQISCEDYPEWRHLEYHGVCIYRVK